MKQKKSAVLNSMVGIFGIWIALNFLLPSLAFAEEPAPSTDYKEKSNPAETPLLNEDASAADETANAEKPGYVTMDFKEADVNTVLRLLSLKSGMNIVAGPEVKGTITIRLENVPWEKALDVVLRTYGYVYERSDNIIRVTTKENLAQEELSTETFVLEYIQLSKKTEKDVTKQEDAGKEVLDIITTMLSERGKVKLVIQRNAIVVTDTPTHVFRIGEVIKRLDQPSAQAYIDSKVVKTQLDKGENLGIRWNLASSGISSGPARPTLFPFATSPTTGAEHMGPVLSQFFPQTSGSSSTTGSSSAGTVAQNTSDPRSFPLPDLAVSNRTYTFGTLDLTQFSALLSFLQSRTNTKVVSNPRIVVLNNQTAKVKVGSEIPIPSFERNSTTGAFEVTGFSFRDVGVVLSVTPHINTANEVLVDLKPEVSALGSTITFTTSLAAPSFDVTNAETQVLIRSGETIAIGGLLQDSLSVSDQQVPYLANLPLVGKIFRSKRQTEGSSNRNVETLFFVTVTVVDTEGQPTGGAKKAKANLLASKDTIGSQSLVKNSSSAIVPAKAGTAG